jgi:peptide/nickel transport system ATP-binding protein/oligopeptide transport system ATP-binding protein
MNADPPVLECRDLSVAYGSKRAVAHVSFTLRRGEVAAIVGESGSGKSQTVLAALRLLPPDAFVEGAVRFEGANLLALAEKPLNAIRGRRIAMVFQEPMSALDPLFSAGSQIRDILRLQAGFSRAAARVRAVELLALVGIPDPERRFHAYPHELSGGQRQRVAIAMAIACKPDVLIADEPTTALDVTVAARILDLLADLRQTLGMAMIFISHDLGLVSRFAENVYVMAAGEIVESGPVAEILSRPRHRVTQNLLGSAPGPRIRPRGNAAEILVAKGIRVAYKLRGGFFSEKRVIRAVDGVSLSLAAGRTLGVVGESGSGKSTVGRALMKLVPASGEIRFEGRDIAARDGASSRALRRAMQMVFQDPYSSLSPRMRVGDIVTEGLRAHEPGLSARERDARAAAALQEVRLDPQARHLPPRAFSGGQRQRIAVARAIILRPRLLVLDEPTSALDRSAQAEILELLQNLQAAHGLAYVLISHDLGAVRAMADDIAVMKEGRIVEQGPASEILKNPRHVYTVSLIEAAFPHGIS